MVSPPEFLDEHFGGLDNFLCQLIRGSDVFTEFIETRAGLNFVSRENRLEVAREFWGERDPAPMPRERGCLNVLNLALFRLGELMCAELLLPARDAGTPSTLLRLFESVEQKERPNWFAVWIDGQLADTVLVPERVALLDGEVFILIAVFNASDKSPRDAKTACVRSMAVEPCYVGAELDTEPVQIRDADVAAACGHIDGEHPTMALYASAGAGT